MTMLEHALEYARLGLRVLPLYWITAAGRCSCGDPSCDSQGKHPLYSGWDTGATTVEDTVKMWWKKTPNANIGAATGAKSGYVTIDIDKRHNGFATLERLTALYGTLDVGTWKAHTGGDGLHFYFKHPGGKVKNKAKIAEGIDIRGDGGYAVLPPSNHVSGGTYSWINDPAMNDLQPLPPEWEQMLRKNGVITDENSASETPRPGLGPVPEKIAEGGRNDTLFRYGSLDRRNGKEEPEILASLLAMNKLRCKPPLSEKEVRSIAKSICERYQPGEGPDKKQEPLQFAQAVIQPKERPRLQLHTGADLEDRDVPETQWIWDGRLAVGLAMLAGAPKVGKSWMALALAMAVARGEEYLGKPTVQGGVLYFGLEDSESRIKKRAHMIDPRGLPRENFHYQLYDVPIIGHGLTEAIEEDYLKVAENPKLIVIDILGKVRGEPGKNESGYQYDMREMAALKKVADKYGVCILLVHHKRKEKGKSDDIFDAINGTQGIFGAMDATLLLDGKRRDAKVTDASLNFTGRDVEADKLNLAYENGVWRLLGIRTEDEEEAIVALLKWKAHEEVIDWQGTAADLRYQLIPYDLRTDISPTTIGIQLSKAKFVLRARHGLLVEQINRSAKSRKWRITTQAKMPEFEEVPAPIDVPEEFLENDT